LPQLHSMRDLPARLLHGDSAASPVLSEIDEAAESWVRRIESGLTVAGEVEFADWLATDPRHEASFRKYQAAWDRFAPLAAAVASDSAADPNRFVAAESGVYRAGSIAERTVRGHARPAVRRWVATSLAVAAAVALLLAIFPQRRGLPGGVSIALPALCEQHTLSDGSVVQLNRGAEVSVNFNDAERRVRLERGEAIFTVASDFGRPFIVAAGMIEVRALGTAFNVRMESVAVEVVVTKGTVQLGDSPASARAAAASAADGGPSGDMASSATIVTAGQSARIAFAASESVPQVTSLTPDEMEARLAWHPRLLNFDDAPLSAIVVEFNRRNPVHLVVNDPMIADRRMTATFRSDNLEAFVRLLESNIGVRAVRLSDTEIALVRR
jgi:transmembrane sensor